MRRARLGVWLFGGLLWGFSLPVEWLMIRAGQMSPGWTLLLMWIPAIASVLARLLLREGFQDVSLRLFGRAGLLALLMAWGFPFCVGAVAYGIGWGSGLCHFEGTVTAFLGRLCLAPTLLIIDGTLFAFGEELGWRGYLLTRLVDSGIPRPILVSGLIWAVWHVPLLIGGVYPHGGSLGLAIPVFAVTVVAVGYVMAKLRLSSGSVWPAVLLHATWNSVIQQAFDAFTPARTIWHGETGILVAASTDRVPASGV